MGFCLLRKQLARPWPLTSDRRSTVVKPRSQSGQQVQIHLEQVTTTKMANYQLNHLPEIHLYSSELLKKLLRNGDQIPEMAQLALVAENPEQLAQRLKTAINHLEQSPQSFAIRSQGIFFRRNPYQAR